MLASLLNAYKDPLYKNSSFIMLTTANNAVFGFCFWLIAANLYSKVDVGICTALVSSMALITLMSRVGLDHALVRFFPNGNKSKIFSTSIVVSSIIVIIAGLVFILGINIWAANLNNLQSMTGIIFIIFLLASSIGLFTGNALITMRRADGYFYQNLLLNTRVIFVILLVPLGFLGIYAAIGLSSILAIALAFILLFRLGVKIGGVDTKYLNESFGYSSKNYVSNLLQSSSNYILPLLVLNILGVVATANFNITFSLITYLFTIPDAVSFSLFVEGSNGENLKRTTIKSLGIILALLVPIVILLFLFGGLLLQLFGKSYVENFDLLKTLAISTFFMTICSLYSSIKKVQKDMNNLILLNLLVFTSILISGYVLMRSYGLIGIGYAFIIGYGLSSVYVIIKIMTQDLKTFKLDSKS